MSHSDSDEVRERTEAVLRALRAESERRRDHFLRRSTLLRAALVISALALTFGTLGVVLRLSIARDAAPQEAPPEARKCPNDVEPETARVPRLIAEYRQLALEAETRHAGRGADGSGTLAKSDIVRGMDSVKDKVNRCAGPNDGGTVIVYVTVDKRGRVLTARVDGRLAGTLIATCVEAALGTAQFPPSNGLSTPWFFGLRPPPPTRENAGAAPCPSNAPPA